MYLEHGRDDDDDYDDGESSDKDYIDEKHVLIRQR